MKILNVKIIIIGYSTSCRDMYLCMTSVTRTPSTMIHAIPMYVM